MKIVEKLDECTGCETCKNICPNNCISMIPNREGFLFPAIDKKKCIECNMCKQRCPVLSRINFREIDIVKEYPTFVGYSKKNEVVNNSTSGGVFFELSRYIIQNNRGVVYGAAYDESFHVKHIRVDSMEQCHKLSGSKYVQSEIGDIYKRVKTDLLSGKYVLFSGCGCQIAALKSFLGQDYDKLLTVSIICHGVPSPGVWDSYISKYKKIEKINFRDKSKRDWINYFFSIKTRDREYLWEEKDNPYTYAFIKDITVRKSCFICKFKSYRSDADLMIGDAWGVKHYCNRKYNHKGTSLIIVYTEKGHNVLNDIRSQLMIERVFGIDIYKYNQRIIKSTEFCKSRQQFERLTRYFPKSICLNILFLERNK